MLKGIQQKQDALLTLLDQPLPKQLCDKFDHTANIINAFSSLCLEQGEIINSLILQRETLLSELEKLASTC